MLLDFHQSAAAVAAAYLDPPPSDSLFDVLSVAGGVAVPAAGDIMLVEHIQINTWGSFLLGFSTSPTARDVTYSVLVNGTTMLTISHQPTDTLWTIYPLRLRYDRGPVVSQVWAKSNTGGVVAGVFARLAGYAIAGERTAPRRMAR